MEQNFFLYAITLYDVKKHILNDNVYIPQGSNIIV